MKYVLTVLLQLAAATILSSSASGKSWHGIIPLHSTRADIEKLWGKPLPAPADSGRAYTLNDNRSIYFIDEGEVYVLYARFTLTCDKSISPDTVMWLSYTPKREIQLSDLHIKENKFRTYDPAEPKGTGYKAYTNEAEGYSILTFKGLVQEIYYQPTVEDRKLCPYYFENGACIPFSIIID